MPVALSASVISTARSAPLARRNKRTTSGMHVNSVGDDVGGEPVVGQHRAQNARLAMVERAHGVEGMRGVARARRNRRFHRRQQAVAVAQADAHAASRRLSDQVLRFGQFRRHRHQRNLPPRRLPQAIEHLQRRRQQMLGGVHAALGMAEERAFQVDAERLRAQAALAPAGRQRSRSPPPAGPTPPRFRPAARSPSWGNSEVTPCFARKCSSASSAPALAVMTSCPAPPWMWMSMNPGASTAPGKSRTCAPAGTSA